MTALFHDNAIVATLGSGSRGNCTYIGDGRRGVLVDCGLSTRQIVKRLDQIGLGDTAIDAVLVTHEHCDHVGAARVLDRHLHRRQGQRVPFYMTRGTAVGVRRQCMPQRVERVEAGRSFRVGAWHVEPYTVPHDTQDPVAFVVSVGRVRVGVLTDLGRTTRLVERQVASMDMAVIEFNHDVQMLMGGEYPWRLKQRVRGPHGHLSNDQAAELLRRAASSRLKHLVLAHLSEDNNDPELAMEAAQEALHHAECTGVNVEVAHQQVPLDAMSVRTPRDYRPVRPLRRRRRRKPVAPQPDDSARQVPLFG